MHYSLFCSLSGAQIDKSFSPTIERQSLGFPMGRNILFIMINDKLYFIKDYETVVYQLT